VVEGTDAGPAPLLGKRRFNRHCLLAFAGIGCISDAWRIGLSLTGKFPERAACRILNGKTGFLNCWPPGRYEGPRRAPAVFRRAARIHVAQEEDVAMRTYDFAPLWRSSVGFDRLFDLLNDTQRLETQDNYPPYDIVRTGEETYRISLALAGFSPEDITVTLQQNMLTVTGRKTEPATQKPGHEYLYQGIAAREFERQFSLEDHVEVDNASFENGLLQIHLVRRIPEAMKPRRIEIGTGKPTGKGETGKTIDHIRAAS
jgi:molecular chaperone IbpA